MKKTRFYTYILFLLLLTSPFWSTSWLLHAKSGMYDLSLQDNNEKVRIDSLTQDSAKQKKPALDAPVSYSATDSIIFVMSDNHGYLYGDGKVDYQTMSVKSENMVISMDSSIVHATYGIDSVGQEFGYPVFSDNGTEYEMKSVSYNFKSKKGYIRNVITQQGEGYIVADKAKKNADDSFFICDGKYTTCENHDHPHFYMMLTKAKVRPKKNVVTGPAYLVIEDLPLPIAIPFGFFPFTEKYSSGILMPSYGDDMDRGFSLRNGGYYFAINDYIDLALTGEIYTKGSWGLAAKSNYKRRYKYNGSFDINYLYTKYGDKDISSTYRVAKDFSINWQHSQDPKANMFRTLSANVRYSTSTFNRYNQENWYNPEIGTAGTKSSSVTLTQRFPNSPFSLSLSASANQRTQDSTVSLTLPNVTITMSRIYPFKRKNAAGAEKWFEKIQLGYSGDLRNSITTKDNLLFKSNLIKDWQNGMQHRIPVSATFNLLNYINITPTFNYTERWYSRSVEKEWDAVNNRQIATDTTYSFYRSYDFNYAVSLQTKLYGFYTPIFKLGKLKTIRHVFTPSIGFSGNPDFSDPVFGSYKSYSYLDQNGILQKEIYSPFTGQAFSPPSKGKSSNLNFGFDNNLEMKVGTKNDSTKIISLIDQLSVNFNYNMAADMYKWSDISTNLRLKLSKSLMVNVAAAWDPYAYKWDPVKKQPIKLDQLRISKYGTLARLKSTSFSISPNINQDTFKKWFGGNSDGSSKDSQSTEKEDDGLEENSDTDKKKESLFKKQKSNSGDYDEDGYLKNQVRWNLGMSYSVSYGYGTFNQFKNEYKGRLSHNFSFNGSIQPTKNWNFSFTSSYDFDQNKIAYMNCTLSRDLHCWNISASFVPFGPTTSYYVSLRVNASMLQDLKYEQRSRPSSFDPAWD